MLRLISCIALIAAANLAGAAPVAHADDLTDVEIHVRVDTVDFNDPVQVKKLYHKLTVGAHYVCAEEKDYDACVSEKVNTAVTQINRVELSRLEDTRYIRQVELSMNSPHR